MLLGWRNGSPSRSARSRIHAGCLRLARTFDECPPSELRTQTGGKQWPSATTSPESELRSPGRSCHEFIGRRAAGDIQTASGRKSAHLSGQKAIRRLHDNTSAVRRAFRCTGSARREPSAAASRAAIGRRNPVAMIIQSSATRSTRGPDCNHGAYAGFAAAHG